MKKKYFVKFLALSMMFATLAGSMPVSAAEEVETSLAANGGADVGYELNISDSFKLAIPKSIILTKNADGDYDADYNIKMVGCDIAPTKQVRVSSSTSIDVNRTGTNDTKSVTNDMNSVTKDTIDDNVIFTGQEAGLYTGYMNGGNLTAGTWRANTEFVISLEDKQTDDTTQAVTKEAGLYDAKGNMICALTKEQAEVNSNPSNTLPQSLGIDSTRVAEVVIPEGTTKIGMSAFQDCTNLTSVTMPDSVTDIGVYAFSRCTNLRSVKISNSLIKIQHYTFENCTSLTSVTIPNSVTTIESSAFKDCTSLTSVAIPDSVTSIDGDAFNNCRSLTSVTIPNSVTSIGNGAFYNVPHIYYNGRATGQPWGAITIN